jgi:hypothetical protein
MKTTLKIAMAALGLATALAGASGASATTDGPANHARRAEVVARLDRQEHRIAMERREGELTRFQARHLRREDRHIRAQERRMASRDGGRITRGEQRRLNREEDRVGRQIGA